MVEFKFIDYGTDFGTRDMGQKLRQKLLTLINTGEKIVLDFTGVVCRRMHRKAAHGNATQRTETLHHFSRVESIGRTQRTGGTTTKI